MTLGTLLSAEYVRQVLAATLLRRVPASYPSVMRVRESRHSAASSTSDDVWTGMRRPALLQQYMGVAMRALRRLERGRLRAQRYRCTECQIVYSVRVLSNVTNKED